MSTGIGRDSQGLNDCGCCEGVSTKTPMEIANRPGLSAFACRVGTHSQFKQSMIAGLSDSHLKTRDNRDFSIALLDAWAMVADVLTFYQERIANESYLRTAIERRSVLEMAKLIGYELQPGVAASTYLAFTLEESPGAPDKVTIDKGTKVQSIPGPGEKPQTYETIEKIEARKEWNELKPQQAKLKLPAFNDTYIYLKGVNTNLKPGDSLLIVGQGRIESVSSEQWETRRISKVKSDAENNRTYVRWDEPLGSKMPLVVSPARGPKVYALRLCTALFGHNAPEWGALPVALRIGEPDPREAGKEPLVLLKGKHASREDSWAGANFNSSTSIIYLDTVYRQVILNSWIVLTIPDYAELYRVKAVGEETMTDYNITAKATRIEIYGENIEKFSPRRTSVYAQSEELELAETPITDPVQGNEIPLDSMIKGLVNSRKLMVSGKRIRIKVNKVISIDNKSHKKEIKAGEELILLSPPKLSKEGSTNHRYYLKDKVGFEFYADLTEDEVTPLQAGKEDESISELAVLDEAVLPSDLTHLKLVSPLRNVYDRGTVTISANVAIATHGETTNEVLSSGNASQSYQRFTLRQVPMTFVSAENAGGGESTLEVWCNDLKWKEVPFLFGHGPRENVYVTRRDDEGKTTVQFGNGETGMRLPTGQENVRVNYRKGIGREGLVKANQLSLLMTRPLGVKGVTNPLPSAGAGDPQTLADARHNVPLTVLTLERIVSLQDYEDFARSYAGIAKAHAIWTWNPPTRGVFITVAGPNGDEIPEEMPLINKLIKAMQKAGNPLVPVRVKSYQKVFFKLSGVVKVAGDRLPEQVRGDVEEVLRSSFSFDVREFGQAVTLSGIISVIQDVPGVVSVDINKLYRNNNTPETYLPAKNPIDGEDDSKVIPAELLMLDPSPLSDLEVRQ